MRMKRTLSLGLSLYKSLFAIIYRSLFAIYRSLFAIKETYIWQKETYILPARQREWRMRMKRTLSLGLSLGSVHCLVERTLCFYEPDDLVQKRMKPAISIWDPLGLVWV